VHECLDQAGILQRLEREQQSLDPGRFDIVELSDPQDLKTCVEQLRLKLLPKLTDWLDRGPQYRIIVDFTGGTKCMSVALGLVCRSSPVDFRYVGGVRRTKDELGVVVSGRELIIHSENPWLFFGYEAAEQATTLFNRRDYGAASRLLDQAARRANDPHVKRVLQSLRALCEAFWFWDGFRHAEALAQLDTVYKNSSDLQYILDADRFNNLLRQTPSWRERLKKLASHQPSQDLIEDLLSNAQRRLDEGRFDDATARSYRAVEAIAQVRLLDKYGIETNRVPLEEIPESVRSELEEKSDPAKLGLQQAYRLLDERGDDLGQRFVAAGLARWKGGGGLLEARNNGIGAHGWEPAREQTARELFHVAMQLAGLNAEALFQFPKL
jgi:CRISPR-associated protein (TIGR02710 family)